VPKCFFDTNILVYQLDKKDSVKNQKCRTLFKKVAGSGEAVISTQVLQEYYVTTTGKLKLDPIVIKNIIHSFQNMEIVCIGSDLIDAAIDTSIQNKLSFWDSLIITAAESANCEILYSEDLNDGQIIKNLKIVNPLNEKNEDMV